MEQNLARPLWQELFRCPPPIIRRRQVSPRVRVITKEQRDWSRPDNSSLAILGGLRNGEPPPPDFPRQAEHVKHCRSVASGPPRQNAPFPRARRKLEAIQKLDHRANPFGPGEATGSADVLPLEQKSHEVGGAHRV